MAKEKTAAAGPFLRGLFQFNVYKRSQGRIARQVTWVVIAIVVALGAWRLNVLAINSSYMTVRYMVPGLLLLVGWWIAFRLVNMPNFADFLIAVEAEMNKVSWPSRSELIRSSLVVICSIFFLAGVLFGYDLFWRQVLTLLDVIHVAQ